MTKHNYGILTEEPNISKKNNKQKRLEVLVDTCVVFYISTIAYLSIFDTLKYFYIFPLLVGLIWYAIISLKNRIKLIELPSMNNSNYFCSQWVQIIVFFIIFSGQLFYWLAYYPGGFNLDAYGQWDQAHGMMQLNNWHPVFTTMIYWIITRIYDSFAFCIFVQLLLFSVSITYLYSMLLKSGFSKMLIVLAALYTGFNPAISLNNICLFKDTYFTIALIWMTVFLIKTVESSGKWLESLSHIILLILDLSAIAFIRHNWIFYSIVLLIILSLIYRYQIKKIFLISLATVLLVIVVQGPLFSLLQVQRHSNTVGEMVGIPMAAMTNVYVSDYEETPEDVKDFLESIADREDWNDKYILGEWDSCKWEFGGIDLFKDQSITIFIKLFIESVKASPDAVYKSIRENTRIVWQVIGFAFWDTWVYIEDNDYGITPNPNMFFINISNIFLKYSLTILGSALSWNIGLPNMILIILIWFAVIRKEYKKLLFSVPIEAYNLLTMLLLCGPSHRYFYFNSVLIIPIIILSLTENRNKKQTS